MTEVTHRGHRERMRQRYEKEGIDHFPPHEVLELLLYITIPQKDVNPLAHMLINRFGSLEAVLRASPEQLMEVPGVGRRTADFLSSLPDIIDLYRAQRLKDRPNLGTLSDASKYCTALLMDIQEEQAWLFNMNMTGYLLHSAVISKRPLTNDEGIVQKILDLSIRYRGQCFLLAQRRLPRNMRANPHDMEMTCRLYDAFLSMNIPLVDHLLVCGHRIYSFRKEGIIYSGNSQTLNEPMPFEIFPNWLEEGV